MRVALIELRRRPGRFAPAAIALVLLTLLLLVLGGLLDGLYNGSTGALRAQPGDLLTYSSDAKLSLVRSRIDRATVAEVEHVPGVEAGGGLGHGSARRQGARPAATRSAWRCSATSSHRAACRRRPQHAGDVYADRSLKAYGVKEGQTLLLGPGRVPGGRGRLGDRHELPAPGWAVGQPRHVAGGPGLGPTRRRPGPRHRAGADRHHRRRRRSRRRWPPPSTTPPAAPPRPSPGRRPWTSLPGLEQQRSTFNSIIYTTFFVAALVVVAVLRPAHPRTHRDVRRVQGHRCLEPTDLHPGRCSRPS